MRTEPLWGSVIAIGNATRGPRAGVSEEALTCCHCHTPDAATAAKATATPAKVPCHGDQRSRHVFFRGAATGTSAPVIWSCTRYTPGTASQALTSRPS